MPTSAMRRASPTEKAPARPRLSLSIQIASGAGDIPVDRPQLRRWVGASIDRDAVLSLRLVGSREARQLNAQFRGRDYATNVLTFAYGPAAGDSGPLEGDIVICMPVLRREARTQRKTARAHLAHLVVHGTLHAMGLDHEEDAQALEMASRETAILRRFRIADPYR
jgi:probable rRNA maturation factor